jgi:hypothetical protein
VKRSPYEFDHMMERLPIEEEYGLVVITYPDLSVVRI